MILALTIAVLVAGSVYLIQQRGMVRIVFGMSLLGHAANLTLLAGGVGAWRGEPFPDRTSLADVHDARVLPDTDEQGIVLGCLLTELAQMHLRGLVGAVFAPHDRVDRQFGGRGTAAQDLADPLVLVLGHAQLGVRLGYARSVERRGDGVGAGYFRHTCFRSGVRL